MRGRGNLRARRRSHTARPPSPAAAAGAARHEAGAQRKTDGCRRRRLKPPKLGSNFIYSIEAPPRCPSSHEVWVADAGINQSRVDGQWRPAQHRHDREPCSPPLKSAHEWESATLLRWIYSDLPWLLPLCTGGSSPQPANPLTTPPPNFARNTRSEETGNAVTRGHCHNMREPIKSCTRRAPQE